MSATVESGDRRTDAEVGGWLALAALLLIVLSGRGQDLLPSPSRMAIVLLWPMFAVAFAWRRNPWPVVAFCVVSGFVLRWTEFWPGGGSDVLPATTEWLDTFAAGGNPYDHFYTSTRPPGDPVPYPPLHFLIHAPGWLLAGHTGVRATQLVMAVVVMVAFAGLAARVSWTTGLPALALYAGMGNLVNLSVDGGMDTGFGAVLLLACLATWWAFASDFDPLPTRVAGIAAAFAVGVKQPGALVVIALAAFVIRRGGRRAAGDFFLALVLILAIASAPFLIRGPVQFVRGLLSFVGAHDSVYGWNLWVLAGQMHWPVADLPTAFAINAVSAIGAAVVTVVVIARNPGARLATAVVAAIVALLVSFLTPRWTSYSYFAAVAPLALLLPVVVLWERRRPVTISPAAAV